MVRYISAASLALCLLLGSGFAGAATVPPIGGHMTDPDHRLSQADKSAIEDRLGNIQQETHIDVAGWIVDAPPESLDVLGEQAYHQWNIGKEWDNAVFFVIPPSGRARLIVDRARPELTPGEQAEVLAADRPDAPLAARLTQLADAAGRIVRGKVFHARPPGAKDGTLALMYGTAALLVALAAGFLSLARIRAAGAESKARIDVGPAASHRAA